MKNVSNVVTIISTFVLVSGCAGTTAISSPDSSKQTTGPSIHIETFKVGVSDVDQLHLWSKVVVEGTFGKIVDQGTASQFASGGGDKVDPPVNLWEFHVARIISGKLAQSEIESNTVKVVRFDSNIVESDEDPSAVFEGGKAILFLTRDVNGARVLVAGDSGIQLIDENGNLVSGTGDVIKGAETLSDFN